MDELNIQSKFMSGIIAKIIKKVVKSKLGIDVDVFINTANVSINDKDAKIHLDVCASMSKDYIPTLLKEAGI